MSEADISYHRQRAQKCREMAESASDPEIRRRHEMLAALHASKAEAAPVRA